MGSSPRLKIDGGIPNQLTRVAEAAGALERAGYDGGWTAETNHDPFLPLLLAAEHTSRLELGTNIAVAFARNPMIVANIGWDLQAYSQGRFILGLGHPDPAAHREAVQHAVEPPGASDARVRLRAARDLVGLARTAPSCVSRVSSTPTRS